MPGRLGGYLLLLHPGPSLVCTAVTATAGWAAARHAGRDRSGTAAAIGRASAAMFLAQVSTGILNDAVDAPWDRRLQPYKPIAAGLVPRGHAWMLAGATAVGALASSRGRPALLRLTGVGLASGWAYSLGLSRTPLSFLPFATGLATVPRTGPAALGLAAPRPAALTGLAAVLAVALHLANGAPDVALDRRAGRRSLPVLLGRERSLAWSRRLLGAAALAAAADSPRGGRALGWGGTAGCLALLWVDRAWGRGAREAGGHPFVLPALGGGMLAAGWLLGRSRPEILG